MSTVHRIALALAVVLLGSGCAVEYDEGYAPSPESTVTLGGEPSDSGGADLPSAPPADLPPEPGPEDRADYLDRLAEADPALLEPGEDEAVTRGREVCRMIVQTEAMEDPEPTRLRRARELSGAAGEAEAQAVLTAARTHICPDL
ncbi:hypothetical protein [Actinorugispora endophytica]|uniref:DUF732 domain-containing protein n=1 Tax=Actinorugispora endophytica TaxID=1605990 RepID=A0A4R6V0Z7_9ACTN|nr:hypothetical protein [Actinorugispora endophytica]TDQ52178.1 hypothetical protein EV190_1078 [Actinorugispora endophytica]